MINKASEVVVAQEEEQVIRGSHSNRQLVSKVYPSLWMWMIESLSVEEALKEVLVWPGVNGWLNMLH